MKYVVVILVIVTSSCARVSNNATSYGDIKQSLENILKEDQAAREKLISVIEEKGNQSEAFKKENKVANALDAKNVKIVTAILDKHGWLGEEVVGKDANIALFVILQHADLDTQEKYFPMLKNAVAKGNARAADLALLHDRIAMRNGKKTIIWKSIGNG